MRVILAGGSGLIGRALTHDLVRDKHEVIILSRDPARSARIADGVHTFAWDGRTQQGWGKLVEGCDAIVNLAGANIAGEGFFPTRWSKNRKASILQSRTNAGKAITEAIESAQVKPKVLVQGSAIGFYGLSPAQAVDEDSDGGDDYFAEICREWEKSTEAVEGLGVRRVIIRTGIVLSDQGGTLSRLLLPIKLFAGGPFGNGKQMMSWIHMADEVAAIRFLIDHAEAQGAYNLATPNPVSNAGMGKDIAKILRRPYYLPVPGFAMRLLFGEVASVVLSGQQVLPKRLLESGFQFKFPGIHSALVDILR